MLGHDLRRSVPAGVHLTAYSRAELDVTDASGVEAGIARARPEVIVNATGYTAVDRAEADRAAAFAVNAIAVAHLAQAAARGGALLVHYSTDYVFDGHATAPYQEDAPTHPLNVYGESKLAGEEAVRASGGPFLLIRTQWLFGAHGRSFPRTMLERARKGLPTRVVTDQIGRPTYTPDLAGATWTLVSLGTTGIVHVTNEGTASWFDVADWIFRRLGARAFLQPCSSAEYPLPAARPRWSVLDTTAFRRASGAALPRWEDALSRFVEWSLDTYEWPKDA
jgi:dTDP-4-dehydrorhamnose reductase